MGLCLSKPLEPETFSMSLRPQTPLVKPDAFPGTPFGLPPMTPSGPGGHGQPAPMTPPQNRVKNAKEE